MRNRTVIYDSNDTIRTTKANRSLDIKKEIRSSGVGTKRGRDQDFGNVNNTKRLRLQEEELKEHIFNIFANLEGTEDSLTLKDLNKTLHQPDKYLKEVLATICDVQRKNVNRYSLKPEYKQS
jgi:hypothetical protein